MGGKSTEPHHTNAGKPPISAQVYKLFHNAHFTEYYNEVRIQKAKELLERGMPIKEAASSTGYNNLNYFYRIFKKKYGMPPKEYVRKKTE